MSWLAGKSDPSSTSAITIRNTYAILTLRLSTLVVPPCIGTFALIAIARARRPSLSKYIAALHGASAGRCKYIMGKEEPAAGTRLLKLDIASAPYPIG